MTNTTLERAARAVSEAMASVPAKAMNNAEWIDFERKIAHAVLMAVREPSPEQCMAEGMRQWDKYQWENAPAPEAFTAMIDAILNDGEGE